MAYLVDMPATCKARATNPKFALTLLDSITGEFDKSFGGGIFDTDYVLAKLAKLTKHVEWLNQEAVKERNAEYEPEEKDVDETEKFSSNYNGGYGSYSMEDDG